MKSEILFRYSGLAFMAGGIGVVLTRITELVLFPGMEQSEQVVRGEFLIVGTLGLAASLLILLGVIGLYARISGEAGFWGLAAFFLAFLGTGLSLGMNWAYLFALPPLGEMGPAFVDGGYPGILATGVAMAVGLGLLGWVALSLASLCVKTFPRWPSVVMLISILLLALPVTTRNGTPFAALLTNVILGAGPFAYGWALWGEKRSLSGEELDAKVPRRAERA